MKVRKKEIFNAEQWFPGKDVKGVTGDDPTKWCGCVITGFKRFQEPHFHELSGTCVMVDPGDWVITDSKNRRCLVPPKEFEEIYEKV
jgi:hypothetical protein